MPNKINTSTKPNQKISNKTLKKISQMMDPEIINHLEEILSQGIDSLILEYSELVVENTAKDAALGAVNSRLKMLEQVSNDLNANSIHSGTSPQAKILIEEINGFSLNIAD
jgi:predicted nuclease with TOPRIM domain